MTAEEIRNLVDKHAYLHERIADLETELYKPKTAKFDKVVTKARGRPKDFSKDVALLNDLTERLQKVHDRLESVLDRVTSLSVNKCLVYDLMYGMPKKELRTRYSCRSYKLLDQTIDNTFEQLAYYSTQPYDPDVIRSKIENLEKELDVMKFYESKGMDASSQISTINKRIEKLTNILQFSV